MTVSRIAVAAALALGGLAIAAPAAAQAPAATAPKLNLSKTEREALEPLFNAVQAKNWPAASAALPAARAAANGVDARYFVAQAQLNLAVESNDPRAQAAAIDALIATGRAPAATLQVLYRNQAALAQQANDHRKAEAALIRWGEVAPNDPDPLISLAKVKADSRRSDEAARLIARAVAMQKARGQAVPETWLKVGANQAMVSKLGPETLEFSRELVSSYPTSANWRDALLNYQAVGNLDATARLDALRLMRSTKALSGERDYLALADELHKNGYSGEAKAVLDEGVANRMVDRTKTGFKELIDASNTRAPVNKKGLADLETKASAAADGSEALKLADMHLGYGNYAKAADAYRLAAQKGGVDPNLVNTRLGMALGLGGQKAEAEVALRAVTGPRAGLAGYWLVWLNQRV